MFHVSIVAPNTTMLDYEVLFGGMHTIDYRVLFGGMHPINYNHNNEGVADDFPRHNNIRNLSKLALIIHLYIHIWHIS